MEEGRDGEKEAGRDGGKEGLLETPQASGAQDIKLFEKLLCTKPRQLSEQLQDQSRSISDSNSNKNSDQELSRYPKPAGQYFFWFVLVFWLVG